MNNLPDRGELKQESAACATAPMTADIVRQVVRLVHNRRPHSRVQVYGDVRRPAEVESHPTDETYKRGLGGTPRLRPAVKDLWSVHRLCVFFFGDA